MDKRYLSSLIVVAVLSIGQYELFAVKKRGGKVTQANVTRQQLISALESLFRAPNIDDTSWDDQVKAKIAALKKSSKDIAAVYQQRYDVISGKHVMDPEVVVEEPVNEEPVSRKAGKIARKGTRVMRGKKGASSSVLRQQVMGRLQYLLANSDPSQDSWSNSIQANIAMLRTQLNSPDIADAYQRWYDNVVDMDYDVVD